MVWTVSSLLGVHHGMLLHMRTTFHIDDDLYRDVKLIAVSQCRTVTSAVSEALEKFVADQEPTTAALSQPIEFHIISSPVATDSLDVTSAVEIEDYLDRVDPPFTIRRLSNHAHA